MKTKTKIEQVRVSTVSEYVSIVETKRRESQCRLLFRGQRCPWSLLPKIARVSYPDALGIEKKRIDAFVRKARPHVTHNPNSIWDWLAIAQHHGVSTRLLDWTTNSASALWFAIREAALARNDEPVVWMFEPMHWSEAGETLRGDSPFDIAETMVFEPHHFSNRITAQGAVFTIHKFVESQNMFFPLEELGRIHRSPLVKIFVDLGQREQMLRSLAALGVTASSMFPGLDGVAMDVEAGNLMS